MPPSESKGWVITTEWFTAALRGKIAQPNRSGKKQMSGFGLQPTAVTQNQISKLDVQPQCK